MQAPAMLRTSRMATMQRRALVCRNAVAVAEPIVRARPASPSRAPISPRPPSPQPSPITPSVRVAMRIPYRVQMGQSVGVVGSVPELGAWDASKALKLKWSAGDVWAGVVDIDTHNAETVEYKYVIIQANGLVKEWCKGPNRKLSLEDLMGQDILVSELWDEQGTREVSHLVSGGLMDSTMDLLSKGRGSVVPIASVSAPPQVKITVRGTGREETTHKLQDRLGHFKNRLPKFEELRGDVARLVSAGPLPRWVTPKQLKDLARKMNEFEDVREDVTRLSRVANALGAMSDKDLAAVSRKLDKYEEVEGTLITLVEQLANKGGCPVGYQVGKSIAAVAAGPRTHKPWHR